jgi:hypothetical protein
MCKEEEGGGRGLGVSGVYLSVRTRKSRREGMAEGPGGSGV